MANLFRHMKPVPRFSDSNVVAPETSDFDLYFYDDPQEYLNNLGYPFGWVDDLPEYYDDTLICIDPDDYEHYDYARYAPSPNDEWDRYEFLLECEVPTAEEVWAEYEDELYYNGLDRCSSDCGVCGVLANDYEFDLAQAKNSQLQLDFDQRELRAHQGRKAGKARRRDQTIRHHTRRVRAARVVCLQSPSSRAQRAVYGIPAEEVLPTPHLAHSGPLRKRSRGDDVVDRRSDQKWLRVELAQAGLELAEVM